jgi:hypothetical protein
MKEKYSFRKIILLDKGKNDVRVSAKVGKKKGTF